MYYLIVDGLGISHYLRRPKGVHPSTKCRNATEDASPTETPSRRHLIVTGNGDRK